MRKSGKILSLVAIFAIVTSSTAYACHSDYFDEIFAKIHQQKLTTVQLAALWDLQQQFGYSKRLDHRHGLSCTAHDQHVPQFVASSPSIFIPGAVFQLAAPPCDCPQNVPAPTLNELKKKTYKIPDARPAVGDKPSTKPVGLATATIKGPKVGECCKGATFEMTAPFEAT